MNWTWASSVHWQQNSTWVFANSSTGRRSREVIIFPFYSTLVRSHQYYSIQFGVPQYRIDISKLGWVQQRVIRMVRARALVLWGVVERPGLEVLKIVMQCTRFPREIAPPPSFSFQDPTGQPPVLTSELPFFWAGDRTRDFLYYPPTRVNLCGDTREKRKLDSVVKTLSWDGGSFEFKVKDWLGIGDFLRHI